jgi:hypothetical protein
MMERDEKGVRAKLSLTGVAASRLVSSQYFSKKKFVLLFSHGQCFKPFF